MIALFQIFHGVWTLAFFVLTLVNTKTVLPNASCLLAGSLPATTVLLFTSSVNSGMTGSAGSPGGQVESC